MVVVGLFGLNAFTTGELSYQGGERKTFYGSTGFPFANTWETFDNRGVSVATDAVPFDILLHRDTAPVLAWNLLYFTVGRYSGLLPYFFPGLVAGALFLARRAERRPGSRGSPRGSGSVPWRSCATCRTPTPAAADPSATATSSASTRCSSS